MAAISNVDIWQPFIILLVLYALIFGGFKGRALLFCLGFALLFNTNLTSTLKAFVDRRRPKQVERVRMVELAKARPEFLTLFKPVKIRYSDQKDRDRSGPSFPSGHVTNNVTIAVVLAFFLPTLGLALLFRRLCDRMVAGLSRGALAERCGGDIFSGGGDDGVAAGTLRSALSLVDGKMGAAIFH